MINCLQLLMISNTITSYAQKLLCAACFVHTTCIHYSSQNGRISGLLKMWPPFRPPLCTFVKLNWAICPLAVRYLICMSCPVWPAELYVFGLSVRRFVSHNLRVPLCVQCPANDIPFQQIIMHVLQCPHDVYVDAHLLFCFDLDLHLTGSCFVHVHQHAQPRFASAGHPCRHKVGTIWRDYACYNVVLHISGYLFCIERFYLVKGIRVNSLEVWNCTYSPGSLNT